MRRRRRNGHSPSCVCESCFEPVLQGLADQGHHVEAPEARPEPETEALVGAELQAALDRMYNLGIEHGRQQAARKPHSQLRKIQGLVAGDGP
jgi:hypothetical protein